LLDAFRESFSGHAERSNRGWLCPVCHPIVRLEKVRVPFFPLYERGDVVLVSFLFTDESGAQLRPAIVVSSSAYNRARQEAIIAAITSNVRRRFFGDHLIADWKSAGLLFPPLATGIVRTIKQAMIKRKLGSLSKPDMEAIDRELHRCLDLRTLL